MTKLPRPNQIPAGTVAKIRQTLVSKATETVQDLLWESGDTAERCSDRLDEIQKISNDLEDQIATLREQWDRLSQEAVKLHKVYMDQHSRATQVRQAWNTRHWREIVKLEILTEEEANFLKEVE